MPHVGPAVIQGTRFRQGDQMQINAWSSVAMTLAAHVTVRYDGDGGVEKLQTNFFTTGSARSGETFTDPNIALRDGTVLDAQVGGFASIGERGQTYVMFGWSQRPRLCKGYLYKGHPVTMGEFVEAGPAGGHGWIRNFTLTAPAAGADFGSVQVTTGALWRIRGYAAQLVTAVGAANRFHHLDMKDGTVVTHSFPADAIQIASLTYNYRGVYGVSPKTTATPNATGGILFVSIPDNLFPDVSTGTGSAWSVNPVTDNIQAADQWGTGQLIIEEWTLPR